MNFLLDNFYYISESEVEFSVSFIKNLFGLVEKNQNVLLVRKETSDVLKYLSKSIELVVVDKTHIPTGITRLLAEFKEDNS